MTRGIDLILYWPGRGTYGGKIQLTWTTENHVKKRIEGRLLINWNFIFLVNYKTKQKWRTELFKKVKIFVFCDRSK